VADVEDVEPALMTMVEFGVALEQRLHDKLDGKPIDPRIAHLQLCNLDRRADRVSLYVINHILDKEGGDLLFHLTLMRAGANSVEGYQQLLTCLRPRAKIDLSGFTAGWGHSYRRPIPMAKNKERKIERYWLESAGYWLQISKSPDSATTYGLVLKYLGGTAKFTAYQICLDLGYKHPHLYDEDAHVVCGPGCEMTAEQVQEMTAERQPFKMRLTLQTVEGLSCEYRKYKAGRLKRRNSTQPIDDYRRDYIDAMAKLAELSE
jgi:hypothetical protein